MNHIGCACASGPRWNRRNFLAMAAAASMATVVAACAPNGETPAAPTSPSPAPAPPPAGTLFRNVRVLDVRAGRLGDPTDVLVRDKTITAIGGGQPVADGVQVIDGRGRTLMPGLIDSHSHLMFCNTTYEELFDTSKTAEDYAKAALVAAEAMLLRGFTSVRDAGGPVFPLVAAINSGKAKGPRVWPSGGFLSQTGGHGDFRTPDEASRRFTGKPSRAEEIGATYIVDGRDEVLTAARENLRNGATQIKMCAGGGVSSAYDPLDTTQFTVDELRAGVDAASDWNTYVFVHAYTPKAVRRSIEAGVACIDHGHLLDEPTMDLLAEKGIWLGGQYLVVHQEPEAMRIKGKPISDGNERVWPMARKAGVKLGWGTDFLFDPHLNDQQNTQLLKLTQWFNPADLIRLATLDNATLLGLSGPRSRVQGALGVVEPGAVADLILVNGDPLQNIQLIGDPGANFNVVMKDGVVYKNS